MGAFVCQIKSIRNKKVYGLELPKNVAFARNATLKRAPGVVLLSYTRLWWKLSYFNLPLK